MLDKSFGQEKYDNMTMIDDRWYVRGKRLYYCKFM